MEKLLEINHFSLRFKKNEAYFYAVKDLNLEIKEGEILALVGESGSGKSLSSLSILGLEPKTAEIKGEIKFKDKIIFLAMILFQVTKELILKTFVVKLSH
jgi:ABC-type glutathione transport system ATPase component